MTLSRAFLVAACILFALATLVAGGVVTGTNLTWLLPAGLLALALSALF
jgi:hypothetical protein